MHSIVLVHLGNQFFDYINDCIEQIKRFNNCNVYLVTEDIHRDRVLDKTITFIPIHTLPQNSKHETFNNTTQLNKSFRGGFWKFATERFFLLERVMEVYKLENVFHLENDNLIYCDVENYLKIFEEEYNIAAIFDNDNRCIPGFMYFKNTSSISDFTSFILGKNGVNDMELLPQYKNETGRVKNLPILPFNYDLPFKSQTGLTTVDEKQYFTNLDKFNSIFDGAAIGQYIGGIDPRNQAGNTVGFINESSLFDVSKFNFEFHSDDKGGKTPFLVYKEQKYKINNLHVHCKNLRKLM
jgi:hypothetical protein